MKPQLQHCARQQAGKLRGICLKSIVVGVAILGGSEVSAESPAAEEFHSSVQPILKEYCYDCHGDGAKKGQIAFDELTDDKLLNNDLWFKVLKNTRAELMPPEKKPRPSAADQQKLEHWIKYAAFGLDPNNPDPGRVTVRRLNRVEYKNTIHDLMGIDFNAEAEFPPDDTGYGFDDIGDVLTVSPMLLEKYLAAAKDIVTAAVPTVSRVVPEHTVPGKEFSGIKQVSESNEIGRGVRRDSSLPMTYYEPAAASNIFSVEAAGSYSVALDIAVKGTFDFDPGRCRMVFKINDREVLRKEFGWYDNKTFHFEFNEKWDVGAQHMTVELEPLTPVDQKLYSLDMRIADVVVRGPMEKQYWTHPTNYERFFTRDAPENPAARRAYARELLGDFASKAFRRPVDARTSDRLAEIAEEVYSQPEKTFEAGVAHAMVAVLASPRFLFRLEKPDRAAHSAVTADVDEYSLASRLSYFLWTTMPDDELIGLARHGQLRANLDQQVKRMLADQRSEKMVQNFTGQWLQTRDVDGISIDARTVLARDSGQERELREAQAALRARFDQSAKAKAKAAAAASTNQPSGGLANLLLAGVTNTAAQTNLAAQNNATQRRRGFGNNPLFRKPRFELDGETRDAMRRETEMFVASIVHEDRPVTQLIDCDYTFLNEKLAKFYGISNVIGSDMQRVALPADSPRGGVLTEASTLVVTSNPDRTSPVKRGLFILDNFMGTPTPPPPPNIPALEAAEKDIKDHEPTLREALKQHRDKPLCASCHSRMDPIGLAFENFNAMGIWRDKERNQTIETSGMLVTGESFQGVRELKHILANEHREDFYRCLTEKFLTYALGRGTEYYDVETIDQIVQRLDREGGRFSALLTGVIESAPFQKMRLQATPTATASVEESKDVKGAKSLARNER